MNRKQRQWPWLVLICVASWSGRPAEVAAQPSVQDARDAFSKSYQYERTQNYPEAIRVLLNLQERSYLIDLRLGWLYHLSGNYANARQFYTAAMQAAPKAIEPRLGYTLPLLAQARYDEVEATTKTILMMDANNYLASLRLSFALRMQKKFPQAREVNAAMLELLPTDVSFLTEQLLVSVAMNNSDVRKLAEMILTLDPENFTAKQYAPGAAVPTKTGVRPGQK